MHEFDRQKAHEKAEDHAELKDDVDEKNADALQSGRSPHEPEPKADRQGRSSPNAADSSPYGP